MVSKGKSHLFSLQTKIVLTFVLNIWYLDLERALLHVCKNILAEREHGEVRIALTLAWDPKKQFLRIAFKKTFFVKNDTFPLLLR